MVIKEAKFLTSAADKGGFLKTDKPVVAVCGKSNVGKSSFINMLANRNKLARTSAEPGRTRLVNYFDFGPFILADLPGYGYARVSGGEKLKWAKLCEDFFRCGDVAHVFALADIRHEPTADDKTMIDFLYYTQTSFTIVATKADKLAKKRVKEALRKIAACLKTGEGNVFAVSSQTRQGREEILSLLEQICEREKADTIEQDAAGQDENSEGTAEYDHV